MTRPTPRARSGFTLIEVLATLVLLAIALPAVMQAASVALSSASTARRTTEAAALGEAKLNELLALNEWTESASGDFAPEHPDYRWTIESASRDYGVYDVRLNVIWMQQGKERALALTTLAYSGTGQTETP